MVPVANFGIYIKLKFRLVSFSTFMYSGILFLEPAIFLTPQQLSLLSFNTAILTLISRKS